MKTTVPRADRTRIEPEWQDPGDGKPIWAALEDEGGGQVRIAPTNTGLTIPPNQDMDTSVVEAAS